jgi:hypothetical protein
MLFSEKYGLIRKGLWGNILPDQRVKIILTIAQN